MSHLIQHAKHLLESKTPNVLGKRKSAADLIYEHFLKTCDHGHAQVIRRLMTTMDVETINKAFEYCILNNRVTAAQCLLPSVSYPHMDRWLHLMIDHMHTRDFCACLTILQQTLPSLKWFIDWLQRAKSLQRPIVKDMAYSVLHRRFPSILLLLTLEPDELIRLSSECRVFSTMEHVMECFLHGDEHCKARALLAVHCWTKERHTPNCCFLPELILRKPNDKWTWIDLRLLQALEPFMKMSPYDFEINHLFIQQPFNMQLFRYMCSTPILFHWVLYTPLQLHVNATFDHLTEYDILALRDYRELRKGLRATWLKELMPMLGDDEEMCLRIVDSAILPWSRTFDSFIWHTSPSTYQWAQSNPIK